MSGPVEIKEASALDLDHVMTVMNKAFDRLWGEAWTVAQCAGVMSLPGSGLFVAWQGGRAVGFALVRSVGDEAELLLIAVRPDVQRSGVGETLVNHVFEVLLNKNVAIIHLEVRANNPALSFYNRLGFEKVGERRDYYRGSDGRLTDAITLSRPIR